MRLEDPTTPPSCPAGSVHLQSTLEPTVRSDGVNERGVLSGGGLACGLSDTEYSLDRIEDVGVIKGLLDIGLGEPFHLSAVLVMDMS